MLLKTINRKAKVGYFPVGDLRQLGIIPSFWSPARAAFYFAPPGLSTDKK